jgi:Family of unknown function (DUF5681)
MVITANASTRAEPWGWIMTADNSDNSNKVGYCKPPVHSRWKPGHCPNPPGRPKGALNLKTEIKLMLEAPIVVNDNGKLRKMTTLRALLLRLREMALKGNVRGMALLLEHAFRHLGLVTEPLGGSSKEDQAILDAYREEIRAETNKDDAGSRRDDSEDPK